jgi:flavin-binding protein dodecin
MPNFNGTRRGKKGLRCAASWLLKQFCSDPPFQGVRAMARKSAESGVYRVTEVIGTSAISWEDAAKNAVQTAAKSLRDLRIAEVTKLDVKIENGKVAAFRTRIALSFKYDS